MRTLLHVLVASGLVGLGCDSGHREHDPATPSIHLAPPVSLAVPGQPFVARSALWATGYFRQGLLSDVWWVYLLEDRHACEEEGVGLRDGERALQLLFRNVDWGECAVVYDSSIEPTPGCTASAMVTREPFGDPGNLVEASSGVLRVEPADGEGVHLVGHLAFPEAGLERLGCSPSDNFCHCSKDGESFTCNSREGDLNCCDDDAAMETVVIDVDISRCEGATYCDISPCAGMLGAGADVDDEVDCELSCSAFPAVCEDCTGCPGAGYCEWVQPCDPDLCLSRCRSGLLTGQERVSLKCLEGATTCDGWSSCLVN